MKTKASEIGVHQQAFELLLSYVQTSVVDNNRPEYLGSIHKLCHYVDETVTDSSIERVYPVPKTIGEKMIHAYGDKVKLDMRSKNQGLVLYNSELNRDEALRRAVDNTSSNEFKVIESTRILHSCLVKIMKSSPELPFSLSLDDFRLGQAQPPDLLLRFFKVLLTGQENKVSEKV